MAIRVRKSPGWSGQTVNTKKIGLGGRILAKKTILTGADANWVLDPTLSVYDGGGLITSISNPGTLGGTWVPWQSNSAYSPTYVASAINGYPGLIFGQDDSSDVEMLHLPKTSLNLSTSRTFYFVYDRGSISNAAGVSANTLLSTDYNFAYLRRDNTYFGGSPPNLSWGYSGGFPDFIQPAGTASPEILVVHTRASGNAWFVRLNGATILDSNMGNDRNLFATYNFFIGNYRSSFGRSSQFVGTICWGEFREGQTDSQVIARESIIKSHFGL